MSEFEEFCNDEAYLLRWAEVEKEATTPVGADLRDLALLAKRFKAERDELLAALKDVTEYVTDILTGPILAAAGVKWPVKWPDDKPQGPLLSRARAAIDKAEKS